jgi:ABC-type transport system substrate-binding protein
VQTAINLLESAGFIDSDGDGWREGPGPEGPGTFELDSIILQGINDEYIPKYAQFVVQAMRDLNISVFYRTQNYREYNPRCYCGYHGDYDMVLQKYYWFNQDLDFYAMDMLTEYISTPLYNTPNWSNSTWDAYAQIVLHSNDYDEIVAAVKEMEHVWVHACPALVLGQHKLYTAYRIDEFEGYIEHLMSGVGNFFSNLRVHQTNEELFGGVLDWGISTPIDSFNHLSYNPISALSVFQMLHDSLVRIDPDGKDLDWLIEEKLIETHADNPKIIEGHSRYTIDIVQNASWSDGSHINATDIAFTLNYLRDNVWWIYHSLKHMFACYSTTDYRLICEFKTESYWHWHRISYEYLIPKRIWLDYYGGYDDYQLSPANFSQMLTSGPFIANNWIKGDLVKLTQNPHYFKNPRRIPDIIASDSSTTSNYSTSMLDRIVLRQTQGFMIGTFCAVVIFIILEYYRKKRM